MQLEVCMEKFKEIVVVLLVVSVFALAGAWAHNQVHRMGGHQTWEQVMPQPWLGQ